MENFGADLIARIAEQAPGVLRFVHKPDKDSTAPRDGTVDLEIGVVGKIVAGFSTALALARATDLIATVCVQQEEA